MTPQEKIEEAIKVIKQEIEDINFYLRGNEERLGIGKDIKVMQVLSLVLRILERCNEEFIAKVLYDTKVKWEALEDFEKVALPKVGIKLYAQSIIAGLVKES